MTAWGGFQRLNDYVDDQPIIWISRGPGLSAEFLASIPAPPPTWAPVPLDTGSRTASSASRRDRHRREHPEVDCLSRHLTADAGHLANEAPTPPVRT
jgi:hypothetical protein